MRIRLALVIACANLLSAAGNDHRVKAEADARSLAEADRQQRVMVTGFEDVIPQFVDGGGWQTTLILTNLSSSTAYFRVYFTSATGGQQQFVFAGVGAGSAVSGQLPAGQTIELVTLGTSAALSQGYAWLVNYDRPANDASRQTIPLKMSGMAIFRLRRAGMADQEAVVPFSGSFDRVFSIPFDNRDGFVTGVALVNNTPQNGSVTLTARDFAGNVILSDNFPLNSLNKAVYVVRDQYPELAGKAGILHFVMSTPGLSGLGLRFNPSGSFTSTHSLTPIAQ